MEEKKYEAFFDYCKQHLLEKLEDYKGTTHYACDLGYTLCEGENCDETLTYSSYEANKYLQAWWWECGEYFQYEKDNFGENLHNPFENSEAYMVCMVIEGVCSILSQCKSINDDWNEKVTLDEKFMEALKEEIEEVTEIRW